MTDYEALKTATREQAQAFRDIIAELDECPDEVYEAIGSVRDVVLEAIEMERERRESSAAFTRDDFDRLSFYSRAALRESRADLVPGHRDFGAEYHTKVWVARVLEDRAEEFPFSLMGSIRTQIADDIQALLKGSES